VVFPKADYKFFFVAKPLIRAKRRQRDLNKIGELPTLNQVLRDIQKRDRHDQTRSEGPLKRAKDAIVLDTTSLTIAQTADKILRIVGKNQ